LSRSIYEPFPPWAEDVAALEIDLAAQLFDELIVLLNGLIVKLRGFLECGPEVFDLLSKLAQQVVTLLRISRP
jgi:hypothetical protein